MCCKGLPTDLEFTLDMFIGRWAATGVRGRLGDICKGPPVWAKAWATGKRADWATDGPMDAASASLSKRVPTWLNQRSKPVCAGAAEPAPRPAASEHHCERAAAMGQASHAIGSERRANSPCATVTCRQIMQSRPRKVAWLPPFAVDATCGAPYFAVRRTLRLHNRMNSARPDVAKALVRLNQHLRG